MITSNWRIFKFEAHIGKLLVCPSLFLEPELQSDLQLSASFVGPALPNISVLPSHGVNGLGTTALQPFDLAFAHYIALYALHAVHCTLCTVHYTVHYTL